MDYGRLLVSENALMIIFGVWLVGRWDAKGMACGYLLASLILPSWLLPRILKRRMSQIRSAQANETGISAPF